jgi:hypothetical protein
MENALGREERKQEAALDRLGWRLRRIEAATSVRSETADDYLRQPRIPIRQPGRCAASRCERRSLW